MPDKYAIRYLPIAVDDLLSISDWIAPDNPARAASFAEKFDKRISSLTTHPLLGHIPKHEKLQAFGYRVLVIESYLVFILYEDTSSKYTVLFMAHAISTTFYRIKSDCASHYQSRKVVS